MCRSQRASACMRRAARARAPRVELCPRLGHHPRFSTTTFPGNTGEGNSMNAKMKYGAVSAAIVAALAAAPLAQAKGTLVYCSEGSPEGFQPQFFSTGTTFDAVSVPMFHRLVEFEIGTTNIVPALAESWTVSPDGKTVTFKLRKGVKFHSNANFKPTRDFNADDVLFSWNRMADDNHP